MSPFGKSSSEPFEFACFGELIWTDPAFRMEQLNLNCSLSIERAPAKHTYFQRYTNHEHQNSDALTVLTEPDAGLFLLRAEKWNNFAWVRVYLSVWVRFPDGMLFPRWSFCKKFMVDVVPSLDRLTVLR